MRRLEESEVTELLQALARLSMQLAPNGGSASPAPTFGEFIPRLSAATSPSVLANYGSYWAVVEAAWYDRRLDEPTPSEILNLMNQHRANAVVGRIGAVELLRQGTCSMPCATFTGSPRWTC